MVFCWFTHGLDYAQRVLISVCSLMQLPSASQQRGCRHYQNHALKKQSGIKLFTAHWFGAIDNKPHKILLFKISKHLLHFTERKHTLQCELWILPASWSFKNLIFLSTCPSNSNTWKGWETWKRNWTLLVRQADWKGHQRLNRSTWFGILCTPVLWRLNEDNLVNSN